MLRRGVFLAGLIGAAAACGEDDKAAVCRAEWSGTAEQTSAVAVQDRKIIGEAAPYAADLTLAAREDELAASIAARRAVAWQVVARALAPVPLASPELATAFGGAPTLPAWHTWYNRDDFERVFKRLYAELGTAGRAARTPFSPATIDGGLAWNPTAIDELSSWPEQRYLDYLAAIDLATEVNGVGNAQRVGYSPGALRHILGSYARTLACREGEVPPPYALDEVLPGRDVEASAAHAPRACVWQPLGPYVVAADSRLTLATVAADGALGDVDLYVRRGAPPTVDDYDCRSAGGGLTERCVVDGDGPVYAALLGLDDPSGEGAAVTVTASYREADVVQPACLAGPFPADAVIIKADWRRDLFEEPLPIYDTSGPRMAVRLRADGSFDWGPGDGGADPTPDQIYTVQLENGSIYRLAGLHLMTKELAHWMWITLWWSDTPDEDFGADRPAEITALPGPWANYKMAVSMAYLEGDADPTGGFGGTLGPALASVHGGLGAPTWASNPYIELGAGNAGTNCIGCHQHGGTDLTAEEIIADQARFPAHGSTRVRNNFFTDYSWAVQGGRGDDLGSIVQAEVDYWDASE